MKNSSHKGAQFERQVARELSLWFSGGKRDDWFYRTSGSGARATVRGKKGQTTLSGHGDIGATCPEGQELMDRVCFELKRGYNGIDILDLLSGKHSFLVDFIDQAGDSARNAEKVSSGGVLWAIIWKRDRKPSLLIGPGGLEFQGKIPELRIRFDPLDLEIVGVKWEDFLHKVSLMDFMKWLSI